VAWPVLLDWLAWLDFVAPDLLEPLFAELAVFFAPELLPDCPEPAAAFLLAEVFLPAACLLWLVVALFFLASDWPLDLACFRAVVFLLDLLPPLAD
jgi:hypothetical protein